MNVSRPKADTEYSRGQAASKGPPAAPPEGSWAAWKRRYESHRTGVLVIGVLGALALLAAEFTPLLHVHTNAHMQVVRTVYTGAHDSYALVPVALLAAVLAFSAWTSGSRLALLAMGLLGLLALGIALLGDLPDAHTKGLVGSTTTGLQGASSSAGIGLYLETLGAVVLIITAVGGMLLEPTPMARPRRPSSSRTRSAS
jgi:hypothetical protein